MANDNTRYFANGWVKSKDGRDFVSFSTGDKYEVIVKNTETGEESPLSFFFMYDYKKKEDGSSRQPDYSLAFYIDQ